MASENIKRQRPLRVAGRGGTFAGSGATVVFKVGAVLALVVLWTLAEIVAGTVVALGAILAGIGLAIIYVQLWGQEQGRGRENGAVIITALGWQALESDPFTSFH